MPVGNPLTRFLPQPGAKTPEGLRLIIGALSGAALSLSFSGLYWSIYSWICLGILLLAFLGARPRIAFACGFLHGLLFVLTSVPWIATVLTVHGGLPVWGGWGVLLLIAMAWGLLIGAFGWMVHRLSQRSIGLACFGTPFIWVTFEFVRAHLPEISFPWNLLGYPAAANPGLLQLTAITGIYGLSFLVAGFNGLLVWTAAPGMPGLKRRLTYTGVVTAMLVTVMLIGPRMLPQTEARHFARAVQLNFPEVDSYPSDWFQLHTGEMEEIRRMSLAPAADNPDLLVWPEAPAPFSFQDSQFVKIASKLAIDFQHPFLAGVIEWKAPVDPADKPPNGRVVPYNSGALVDTQGQRVFVYDKVHLVPFGEYEPFPLIHRVVSSVSDEVGGFHKGISTRLASCPADTNSAFSSATKRSMQEKSGNLRPTGRICSSTFPMTDGSAAPPLPNSTCTWSACEPWKTGAGSCARRIMDTPYRSIRMAASTRRFRRMCAPRSISRMIFEPTRPFTRDLGTGSPGCA